MRILRIVFQEALLSVGVLLISTALIFFIAFYATGDLQKEKLGIDAQGGAFGSYLHWWQAAARGDLAGGYGTNELLERRVGDGLHATLTLVVLTLLITVAISLSIALFLISYPDTIVSALLERLMYFSGAIPVFLIAVVVYTIFNRYDIFPIVDPRNSWLQNIIPYSIAALVLSIGSGVSGELVRLFKIELGKILNLPFIQAVRIRSASVPLHVARAAIVPMSSILVSKVPFFIGAAIIVESVFSIKGLGYLMVEGGDNANFGQLMTVSLLIVLIVLGARICNKLIVGVFDPKST